MLANVSSESEPPLSASTEKVSTGSMPDVSLANKKTPSSTAESPVLRNSAGKTDSATKAKYRQTMPAVLDTDMQQALKSLKTSNIPPPITSGHNGNPSAAANSSKDMAAARNRSLTGSVAAQQARRAPPAVRIY